MRGEATPAQIGGFLVALRVEGRDGGRDRRLRGGDARARAAGAAAAGRSRRHGRDGRRRRAHAQHLDRGGDRRGRGRRGRRQARQPRRLVGLGLRRRAGGARLHARAAARADRALDRRARLRLHVRALAPPGDAARGAGPPRARDAYRVQRARPAHEPGRRARPGDRRLRARRSCATLAEVLAQLGARRAFVVHGAHGIDELSPAGPNLVCEVVDGEVREREIDPLELGVPRCDPDEPCAAARPDENAATIRAILPGADGGARDAILLNAAGRDRRSRPRRGSPGRARARPHGGRLGRGRRPARGAREVLP